MFSDINRNTMCLRDRSEDLASAYANRAACLLRLACPQFALTDIELALENGSDLFFFSICLK